MRASGRSRSDGCSRCTPTSSRLATATPTQRSLTGCAHSFADNKAIRLFYGEPHDLLTVGGYTAWRVGGTLAIFAAIFGLVAAVRGVRTEEDAGRTELVLAGPVGRQSAQVAALVAIGAGVFILWAGEFAGFVLGGLSAGGSAYLALATASVVPVCVGVGAVASQLAPTRRMALELGGAIVALFFLLRVIADTASGVGWLRWTTPLGWAEELRPFAGAHPLVLALPVLATALLLTAAFRIAASRDIGTGANCLPVALLFLGIAALAYVIAPRASAGISYGLVVVTFLWQLVGSLLGAPRWLVDLTPFEHVGLVPAQPFRTGAAVIMVAIGLAGMLVAVAAFRRRDLLGA
jgi:putative exporter of polyketide antibiotics